MFCYKCGRELVLDAKFCSACGAAARAEADTPIPSAATSAAASASPAPQSANPAPRTTESKSLDSDQALWTAAIGKNAPYYLSRFARFEQVGASRVSWNWPALFVSSLWALYRKSWAAATLFFLLPFLVATAAGVLVAIGPHEEPPVYGLVVYGLAILVSWLIPPVFANGLYYRRIRALVKDAKAAPLHILGQIALLSERGGTGGSVFVVAVFLGVIFSIGILASIALPAYQNYRLRAESAESLIASQPQPSQPQPSQPEIAKQAESAAPTPAPEATAHVPDVIDTPIEALPAHPDDVVRGKVSEAEAAAERGDAASQFKVGMTYYKGKGASKNITKALYWFEKAAEQGNADAQYMLGEINYQDAYDHRVDGHPNPERLATAAKWILKAASQGHADAQNMLSGLYRSGEGAPKDPASALEWLQKSVALGNADAMFQLCLMYYVGELGAKDPIRAAEWARRAATRGNVNAQFFIATAYSSGDGVEKNDVVAADWYKKASAQGFTPAQAFLGDAYFYGHGVPKDYVLAYAWNLLATRGASKSSPRLSWLGALQANLTPTQIAEAKRLASAWTKGHILTRAGVQPLTSSAPVQPY